MQIVVTLLTDIGLRQVVVQSPNGDKQWFLNTAWTLQILRGGIIWMFGSVFAVGLYFAANLQLFPASSIYMDPDLPAYIVVASASAIILGFQSMKWMTASRDLQLRRIFFIEVSAQVLSLAFVIVLGWYTRSLWAYIGGVSASIGCYNAVQSRCAAGATGSSCVGSARSKGAISFWKVDVSFVHADCILC